ncbi:MAG: hypothetical protein ACRC6V_01015 [Bacteroidales bacterium]
MQKFNVETIDGTYEIMGTRVILTKYLTIYDGDDIVFGLGASKVLSIK